MSDRKPLSQLSGKEYDERLKEIEKHNEEFVQKNLDAFYQQKNKENKIEGSENFLSLIILSLFVIFIFIIFGFGADNPFYSFFLILLIIVGGIYSLFFPNQGVALSKSSQNYKRKRKPIKPEIKNQVWNRDGGRCVRCGSNQRLEFDHIVPHSKGGADTYRNLQLLCESCNRSKGASI